MEPLGMRALWRKLAWFFLLWVGSVIAALLGSHALKLTLGMLNYF